MDYFGTPDSQRKEQDTEFSARVGCDSRGIFAPGQGLLPKYHHGVYDGRLVVSAGCSNTASIPRWGNETEVVIVRLPAV